MPYSADLFGNAQSQKKFFLPLQKQLKYQSIKKSAIGDLA
jgi:hypothetical protein